MNIKSFLLAASCLCASLGAVSAQNYEAENVPPFDFYTRAPYRESVPQPQKSLRFDVGEQHTTYAQMEKVLEQIAQAAPDRVRVFDIGLTNEKRMQHLVAVSAPENIARLDQIKADISKLADPRATSPNEAANIAQNTPAIAWMAYTIHGNESASFEAMMQVLYQLAASDEPATQEILKNTVVLILTGENPDGHERFATWYNSVAVGSADRNAQEHREPWSIWGRYNRYRFDLNRDNVAATQTETRNMQKAFFEWNPQVSVDHHGQPSQFFFPPAALPINPNLPQPQTNKWLDKFGRANAAQFDAKQWDYYVRDIFDLFYVGYWDSFPALNGATGMTYETDGGGFKGLRWTRDDGSIVTFRSAIAKHYVASLTTLETLAKNRAERLQDFYNFRRSAMDSGRNERLKRIVIVPDKDRVKAAQLIEVLRNNKIEVKVAATNFTSPTAHSYLEKDAPAAVKTFPAGSYIIDLNQPQKVWIKALLEQDTPQDKAFVNAQMEKFRRNQMRGANQPKEEYGFYDITAWSLPLAFGVDAFWTEDTNNIAGNEVSNEFLINIKNSGGTNGRAQVSYVFPYESDGAAALAFRLLRDGFRVNIAQKPLNAGGRDWNKGTFVVRVTRNKPEIHEAVNRYAKRFGISVTAINSGFSDAGDTSVGGEYITPLTYAKIAMLADEGVDQTSYGANWWMLDQYGFEFTPLTFDAVRRGALKDYKVLILPDGNSSRYADLLKSLKSWIQDGGTVVTMRGSAVAATVKDLGLTSARLVGSEDEKSPAQNDEQHAESVTNAPQTTGANDAEKTTVNTEKTDKQDFVIPVLPPIVSPSANQNKVPEGIPGAIFRATVDRTNYLTYGVEQPNLPVLLASPYFFRYSSEGSNVVVFDEKPAKPLTISGFVWEGNTEKHLKGTAYIIDEPVGAGHVIMFAEDPFFRGFFRSTTRIFFNSLVLAPSN